MQLIALPCQHRESQGDVVVKFSSIRARPCSCDSIHFRLMPESVSPLAISDVMHNASDSIDAASTFDERVRESKPSFFCFFFLRDVLHHRDDKWGWTTLQQRDTQSPPHQRAISSKTALLELPQQGDN